MGLGGIEMRLGHVAVLVTAMVAVASQSIPQPMPHYQPLTIKMAGNHDGPGPFKSDLTLKIDPSTVPGWLYKGALPGHEGPAGSNIGVIPSLQPANTNVKTRVEENSPINSPLSKDHKNKTVRPPPRPGTSHAWSLANLPACSMERAMAMAAAARHERSLTNNVMHKCPEGWEHHKDFGCFLHDTSCLATWSEAVNYCKSVAGHHVANLAEPHTKKMLGYIKKFSTNQISIEKKKLAKRSKSNKKGNNTKKKGKHSKKKGNNSKKKGNGSKT